MFAASSRNVMRNRRTVAAIRNQLAKQQQLEDPDTETNIIPFNEREDKLEAQLQESRRELRELKEKHQAAIEEKRRRKLQDYTGDYEDYRIFSKKISNQMRAQMECPFTLGYICDWVCRLHGVSFMDMKSVRRDTRTVHARQAFMYWAKQLTPCSLPQIAKHIGGKDHSTVHHGCKVYLDNRLGKRRHIRDFYPRKTAWWRT